MRPKADIEDSPSKHTRFSCKIGDGSSGEEGTVIWIALSIGMLALVLFSLISMSKHQDRAARRLEKERDPFSDIEITVTGSSIIR